MYQALWALVAIGSAIWVAVDASKLDVKRGRLGGGFFDMGVVGWFFVMLFAWLIAFPGYMVMRPRYVALKNGTATVAQAQPIVIQSATTQPLPAAGWYPDPTNGGQQRWWDGQAWGQLAPPPPSA